MTACGNPSRKTRRSKPRLTMPAVASVATISAALEESATWPVLVGFWRASRREPDVFFHHSRRAYASTLAVRTRLQPQRQIVNLFRVENLIVPLEQLGDGGAVDFHLGAADADGSVANGIVARHGLVEHLDAFDADGRHGVEVNRHAQ